MTYETVSFERHGSIGVLTFNRPESMNAHNYQMRVEEQGAAEEALRDEQIRVLIVTGAGRAFHAGDDAKERPDAPGSKRLRTDRWRASVGKLDSSRWTGQPNPRYFFDYPKPTIAAVNGPAVGGGLTIALSCDIRIAAEGARFGYLYSRRGLAGGAEGLIALVHLLGVSRAMEFALTGEMIDARTAQQHGIVSRVVPAEDLLPSSFELADRLAKGAPLAQQAIKEFIYRALYSDDGLAQFNARTNEGLGASEDYREGFRAFNEKREPSWRGF